ncbi:MAG: ribbon-helix-helix domain-containing protein [Candidatus Paceibacterota bacterium]
MRITLNISMPASFKKNVDLAVKEGNYASISEFFRDAVRAWENDRLIKELKESQRDARLGRVKLLRSLKDLR